MIALVFAELAGRYPAWEKGLEGFDMTESKVVNRWIEAALKKQKLDDTRPLLGGQPPRLAPCLPDPYSYPDPAPVRTSSDGPGNS